MLVRATDRKENERADGATNASSVIIFYQSTGAITLIACAMAGPHTQSAFFSFLSLSPSPFFLLSSLRFCCFCACDAYL